MFNFYKRWEQKEVNKVVKAMDKREEDRNKMLEKAEKVHLKDIEVLDKYNEEMTSKLCPVNNKEKCFKECIHFKHGKISKVSVTWSSHFKPYMWIMDMYDPIKPSCKLWK